MSNIESDSDSNSKFEVINVLDSTDALEHEEQITEVSSKKRRGSCVLYNKEKKF